jgi:MFS family permease
MPATHPPAEDGAPIARPALGRNVVALAVVSFFTDLSSEMIYPLMPLFLSGTLGAPASFVGAIEGAAETTAALLKLASGWWSDRVTRRKPLVVAGYAIASFVRPLVAIATSASQVLAIRVADRVGKGIRSSPRDALIAESVAPSVRGRAFGFHRAADHAGAVVGPLIAYAFLQRGHVSLRQVFWLAAIPGAIAVLVLIFGVRERARAPRRGETGDSSGGAGAPPRNQSRAEPPDARNPTVATRTEVAPDAIVHPGAMGRRFWAFLGVVLLFTLGNSTDAFLLLRANQLGIPVALIPVLWAMLHVVKSASSTPGGALSDRLGRKPLIVAGWLLYALVYFAFARATQAWHGWALFAVYGVYFGLVEGTEKALVADVAPAGRRGTAFGWYNLAVGLGALPASLLFGAVWDRFGPAAAFQLGAALALAAALGMALVAPGRPTAPDAR